MSSVVLFSRVRVRVRVRVGVRVMAAFPRISMYDFIKVDSARSLSSHPF